MKKILKVKDHPNMIRDGFSKAILIDDQQARQNYINQRTIAASATESTEKLKEEVNSIKTDVQEMKDMLKNMIDRLHKYSDKG